MNTALEMSLFRMDKQLRSAVENRHEAEMDTVLLSELINDRREKLERDSRDLCLMIEGIAA